VGLFCNIKDYSPQRLKDYKGKKEKSLNKLVLMLSYFFVLVFAFGLKYSIGFILNHYGIVRL